MVSSERTGGNRPKLKCRKFHVIIGVTKPKEIVESPFLETVTNVTGQGLERHAQVDLGLSRKVRLGKVLCCLPTSAVP